MKQTSKYVLITLLFVFINHSLFAQAFPIQGKWKIAIDDKKEFSQPNFDDVGWGDLEELRWKDDLHKTANRVLWIRKSVVIPSSLKSEYEKTGILTLKMGKISQSDQTYLNGKLVGTTGSGDSYRNYLIKKEDILWDQENKIAIRVGHWGEFRMSMIPTLVAASPEHFFVFKSGIKNTNAKSAILKEDLTYLLNVTNKSTKTAEGVVQADFYDFGGTKISTKQKNVSLSIGENSVEFPFTSASPFLKIIYTLSIPAYQYKTEWNAEFGYDNLVYNGVQPIVPYLAKQNFVSPTLNQQIIGGWLGERLKINTEKRLYKVEEEALLAGFINRPGSHSWIGEHIGKFLEAACNAYANNGDPALKIQIDRSAQQLIAAQLSDGYLGTYEMDSHWTSWDVWSHRYDLMGLLRYYEISGFKPALSASEKIGDLLIKTFGTEKGQKNIVRAGGHVGMAATCALESMGELYRFSGNKKYFEFCQYIIKSFDTPNGPRIISTLDSLGRVDKVANAKAYEMLSNFLGIMKLYRLTNDEQYLKPLVLAWNDIVANRMYITGTASSFEHFQDDHVLPAEKNSNMGEGCVTTTWEQFNYQLFSIFGDIKYLDEIERTVYNHLTGAENPQTGGVSYYTPLMGVKPHDSHITCCMSSVPRGIAMIPFFTNGQINHIPAILFYQAGVFKTTLDNKEKTAVEFKTVTTFPTDGNVSITVNPTNTSKFKVLFRKPYWAADFTLKINQVVQPTSEKFLEIERIWKKGDRVDISFTLPTKILDGNVSYTGKIAIQRGPQVLAFDQKLNKTEAKNVSISENSLQLEPAPKTILPANWVGTQVYQVNAQVNGVSEKVFLVPYADAGQTGDVIATWLKSNK